MNNLLGGQAKRSGAALAAAIAALFLAHTAAAHAAAKLTPHADAAAGWLLIAPDEPVEGAHVRAYTLGGRDLTVEDGLTGKYGIFTLWTKQLPSRYILQSTGGTVNGLPFNGKLRALVIDRGPDRLLYVNPATTIAAQYAVDHPKVPYAEVLSRVKHKLGLLPTTTLGESLRRSATEFDGAAFLEAAAREGGFAALVRKIADDIDPHPDQQRAFPTTRHLDGGPLQSIGTSVGGGLVKAGLGFLFSHVGLASVNDALGLNPNEQLDAINAQLTTINTTLQAITGQLDSLQTGLVGLLAATANSEYANLNSTAISSLSFGSNQNAGVGVLALGTTNDTILSDSTFVAQEASEVADILKNDLPAAATADPLSWCSAQNFPPPSAPQPPDSGLCQKLSHDIGSGGPPAGTDQVTWCASHTIPTTNLAMPDWSCAVLALVAAYPHGSTSGDWSESAYNAFVGSNGADGLLAAYSKMRYTQVVTYTSTGGQPFLTDSNYSQHVDALASLWESRIALLGQYTSIYDTAQPPAPANCTINGKTTLEPVAQCDVDLATERTLTDIPNQLLPDVPDGMMADTRTDRMWFMMQPNCASQSNPYSFSFNDPSCSLTGALVTIGDLTGLLNGWQNWHGVSGTETPSPNLWLTEGGGFPDMSSLANVQPPAGYGPNGWAGNEFSVTTWDKSCLGNQLILDDWTSSGPSDDNPFWISGMLCPTVRLTDGAVINECWPAEDPLYSGSTCDTNYDLTGDQKTTCTDILTDPSDGSPCWQPTSYDWTQPPYNDHVDYFHSDLAFAYVQLAGTPFWVPPS